MLSSVVKYRVHSIAIRVAEETNREREKESKTGGCSGLFPYAHRLQEPHPSSLLSSPYPTSSHRGCDVIHALSLTMASSSPLLSPSPFPSSLHPLFNHLSTQSSPAVLSPLHFSFALSHSPSPLLSSPLLTDPFLSPANSLHPTS